MSVEEHGHLLLSLVVYLAVRCHWCNVCVCVRVEEKNVLLTLRGPLWSWCESPGLLPIRPTLLHVTHKLTHRSNLPACPRYQHSEHLLGERLYSAVHSCQAGADGKKKAVSGIGWLWCYSLNTHTDNSLALLDKMSKNSLNKLIMYWSNINTNLTILEKSYI